MAADEPSSSQPLITPRVPALLKDRPKLLGGGFREEFWEQVERNMAERRTPEKVAEKGVEKTLEEASQAAAPAARDRVANMADRANRRLLKNL